MEYLATGVECEEEIQPITVEYLANLNAAIRNGVAKTTTPVLPVRSDAVNFADDKAAGSKLKEQIFSRCQS